jgi:hypothetical protein
VRVSHQAVYDVLRALTAAELVHRLPHGRVDSGYAIDETQVSHWRRCQVGRGSFYRLRRLIADTQRSTPTEGRQA